MTAPRALRLAGLSPDPSPVPRVLTLPGPPRTKKNSATISRVGTRVVLRPSEAWMAWRDAVRVAALRAGWHRHAPIAAPVNCAALFYRDARRGDACGYYQGLADVLEEIGVVDDDKRIEQWDGSRLLVDRADPRVVLTLTPLAP